MSQSTLRTAIALTSCLVAGGSHAGGATLVLPLRSIGLSDTTMFVSRDLLIGSLRDLGVQVSDEPTTDAPLPSGREACDDPACAAALGRAHEATQVVYGSLSRLGGKVIARLNVLRFGETAPYYRDQLTALSEEDLDTVVRRFAEGIASGRPNSDRATIESVTQSEALTPTRRASRAGPGLRGGFLFPTGASFGGIDRLTNLHAVYKYEMPNFQLETTTLLGLSWGDGNVDWTLLDVGASRILGTGDLTGFLGASGGVHTVTVQGQRTIAVTDPFYPGYSYAVKQTETAPTIDVFAGLLALRTYDFEVVLELRYHYVFEPFNEVGGNGANGFLVTFGTSR